MEFPKLRNSEYDCVTHLKHLDIGRGRGAQDSKSLEAIHRHGENECELGPERQSWPGGNSQVRKTLQRGEASSFPGNIHKPAVDHTVHNLGC